MKLTINTYYDDFDGKYVASRFFIDGEECSEEEYVDMIDELNVEDNTEEENCCECCVGCEKNIEENQFLRVVTDAVNDTLEMFNDENTCDDCKTQALMNLVFIGINGALSGCVVNGDMGEENINLN